MYSLISFLCLSFPKAAVYIDPWLHLVEGLALGSFFLLLCDYVSPLHDQREAYFATKKLGGVKWFRTRWFLIFQMPFVSLLVSIATDITAAAGVYCEFSSKPRFAKFWLSIIQSISLVASVLSILQFYQVLKVDLAHHRPLLKLMAFKAIVGLTFLQGIIFWILTDTNTLKESNTLTYADLHIGMPNLLICIEMVPLALFFTWAYPWSVYTDRDGRGNFVQVNQPSQPSQPSKSYQGGPFGIYAWLAMINPSETLRATMFAFTEGRKAQRATGRADDTDEERLYDNSYRMRPQGQPAAYASYGN
ncbi:hypothetical protein FDECE_10498 [Fusarium decemcellulare]|nr:hypothetical protein FDECE_10498 [Fusarium decemcellulare]